LIEETVEMTAALKGREEPTARHSPGTNQVAFYDVDGTLIKTNVVHVYAYYAANHPELNRRLSSLTKLLASIPAYLVTDYYSRKVFNEWFYKNYKGFSEDRLIVVGEEIFDKIIKPNMFPGAVDLIKRSQDKGIKQVLVTGALDVVTKPLAEYLGVDDYGANRLEIVDGFATGRLVGKLLAGPNKSMWIRDYATRFGLNLDDCWAYADSFSDLPMLSMVGRPCAVNPDFKLRAAARDFNWPVLDLSR
jgi:HAD superfamily hydrolase (TIGR01490 family)